MRDYLEKLLRMNIDIQEAEDLYKELPLLYKGNYIIYYVETDGIIWLAIQPKRDIRLNQIRKDRAFLEKTEALNVALFLDKASFYSKDKMIEDGMPFVIRDDSVYLPFIGMMLKKGQRELKPVHKISFLTQRILLTGIYEGYDKSNVTEISERMGVSKMAVSKSFDEIEYLGIDVLKRNDRRRYLSMGQDRQSEWEKIKPYLRNPVIRVFNLKDDIHLDKKAGISALSEYSMLADNKYPTYAVEKAELKESGILEQRQAGKSEETGCKVFEVGYFIDCIKKNTQDPLSVILSIGDETEDERVEISIEEMLKEYLW